MSHSRLFDAVRRALALAKVCDEQNVSARSAIAQRQEATERARKAMERRAFMGGIAAAGAGIAVGGSFGKAKADPKPPSTARVAIIGGGLAGMACADRLRAKGISAVVYEANSRLGGRCYSSHLFPGQTVEMGGELIDNAHKNMLGYAQEFKLAKEDLGKEPGDVAYYFFGQHHSEAEVVDEMRVLVGRMRDDIALLSSAPDFYNHTIYDTLFDYTSMADYLQSRAGDLPLVSAVLEQAYIAEYGRELSEQSVLNFLFFIRADRRSKFEPFGSSDERYHLVNGNDQIIAGIRDRLPGPVVTGARLTGLRRLASGQYAMSFSGSSSEEYADSVVLAIPFSVLRTVALDPSLGLSQDKLRAITELGYGFNAKTMIGFDARPWIELHGGNGTAYSDLPDVQNTWETNYSQAVGHAVLTDYSGGDRGYRLQRPAVGGGSTCASCHIGAPSAVVIDDTQMQLHADAFLTDLDKVYPGAKAAATHSGGKYVMQFAHWLNQSTSRGSYTCYLPGQFTTLAGLEGEAADLLKFAGEHADSFYWWQGFMEGAVRSGIRAANEILEDIKKGRL